MRLWALRFDLGEHVQVLWPDETDADGATDELGGGATWEVTTIPLPLDEWLGEAELCGGAAYDELAAELCGGATYDELEPEPDSKMSFCAPFLNPMFML